MFFCNLKANAVKYFDESHGGSQRFLCVCIYVRTWARTHASVQV